MLLDRSLVILADACRMTAALRSSGDSTSEALPDGNVFNVVDSWAASVVLSLALIGNVAAQECRDEAVC
jgi:hypothetical protein